MESPRVAVAYSGGRDSTALLHATLIAAESLGVEVLALHVHHGLSARADAWLLHCQGVCQVWASEGLPAEFAAFRATTHPERGASVEAWARQIRYRALREMALDRGAATVLLAHHRRDQAETFILQALRGSGLAGLACMPRRVVREGVTWLRPWLDRPRTDIETYVSRHGLTFIHDDSNEDVRFARNRLRVQVWPRLLDSFAHAESSLGSSAEWAGEALECLAELAEQDLQRIAPRSVRLNIGAWRELSAPRQSNALRAWLKAQLGEPAAATLVRRLMLELHPSDSLLWPVNAGELRTYRGHLELSGQRSGGPAGFAPAATTLSVGAEGEYEVPQWNGRLRVKAVVSGGVSLGWLGRVELRARSGAERFQAQIGCRPTSLKKAYQEAAVPPWERLDPIVYSAGRLVFVPGLGLDARMLAVPGQPQAELHWVGSRSDEALGEARSQGHR